MTYQNWEEPCRRLEERTGPCSRAQRDLASGLGISLDEDQPRDVATAILEDHLAPILHSQQPAPATPNQRAFLARLGSNRASEPSLTKNVASAWIGHLLGLRTIDALTTLALNHGDVVLKRGTWTDQATGSVETWEETYVVSSIGEDGLVYFKGGNGKCAWPSSLARG
jgi:hypothetical protein